MRVYENMKPSTVFWLGMIPAHWQCLKIGSLFSQRKVKVSDKDYVPLSVTKMGILPQLENAAKTNDGDNRKLVCAGDFVINSRSDRKGSCGVSELDGSVSLINLVLTPRSEWNNRYAHYLLRSQPFSEEYYRYGRGIVADLWTTRFSEMKNILIPVPPREEQDQIVRFLDWKVSEINRLINIKRKEIERLEELKKAVVFHAVTKGLDSSAEMKDSGVDWLGTIPSTWNALKIKRLFAIYSGATPQSGESTFWNGDVVWITPADFKTKDKFVSQGAKNITYDGFCACSTSMIPEGSIIFSKRAPVGTVAISTTELCTNQGCLSCVPKTNVDATFFYYVMSICTNEFERYAGGTTFKEISLTAFSNFILPVPPYSEQTAISSYLDKKCNDIDEIIRNKENHITTLQDFKTRLISDVVTGKIDVRGIDIPEYEYADEVAGSDTEDADSEEAIEEQEE